MEITKKELDAIQEAAQAPAKEIKDLRELELSLIGGGCGEVVFG